jgi:hypothetical protein
MGDHHTSVVRAHPSAAGSTLPARSGQQGGTCGHGGKGLGTQPPPARCRGHESGLAGRGPRLAKTNGDRQGATPRQRVTRRCVPRGSPRGGLRRRDARAHPVRQPRLGRVLLPAPVQPVTGLFGLSHGDGRPPRPTRPDQRRRFARRVRAEPSTRARGDGRSRRNGCNRSRGRRRRRLGCRLRGRLRSRRSGDGRRGRSARGQKLERVDVAA